MYSNSCGCSPTWKPPPASFCRSFWSANRNWVSCSTTDRNYASLNQRITLSCRLDAVRRGGNPGVYPSPPSYCQSRKPGVTFSAAACRVDLQLYRRRAPVDQHCLCDRALLIGFTLGHTPHQQRDRQAGHHGNWMKNAVDNVSHVHGWQKAVIGLVTLVVVILDVALRSSRAWFTR